MAHRKPTEILKLTGSLDHNPSRKREREAEPIVNEELGSPPERLTDQQKEAWREIVNNCASGVLTKADRHTTEMAAVLLAEFWTGGMFMKGFQINLLERILSKMGLNPSDRSRVKVPQQKKENPFTRNGKRPA